MNSKEYIGIHSDRLLDPSHNPKERALVDEWKRMDILEGLFQKTCKHGESRLSTTLGGDAYGRYEPIGPPSDRDKIVAETIIQWLGSNVGRSFLDLAANRLGYNLQWKEKEEKYTIDDLTICGIHSFDDLPIEGNAANSLKLLNSLPQNLQLNAMQWGFDDSVVRDDIFVLILFRIGFHDTTSYYNSFMFKNYVNCRVMLPPDILHTALSK